MNNDANDVVMSNLFTFESLVQFPLTSIIQSSANGNSATLEFLNDFCFEVKDGVQRVAKTFTFYYDYIKGDARQTMKVEIPVISLVTIPYYTIDRATFEMGVNIISWLEPALKNEHQEENYRLLAMLGPYNSSLSNAVPGSQSLNQVNTNMKVKMEVVTSDLPAGILQLINVSSQGISGDIASDVRIKTSATRLILDNEPVKFTVKLENKESAVSGQDSSQDFTAIPVTINIDTNVKGVDMHDLFNHEISVVKGDIIGSASYEQVVILTNNDGEVEIELHPSGKGIVNGFIVISSPVSSKTKVYYRIEHAE